MNRDSISEHRRNNLIIFLILLVLIVSCDSQEMSVPTVEDKQGAQSGTVGKWKQISFIEATSNKLVPLELEFTIPHDYEIRYSGNLEIGSIWGTKKDIDSGLSKDNFNFKKIKNGVFRIFWSMTAGYDITKNEFIGEKNMKRNLENMGITNLKIEKKYIGGYPVLLQEGKLNEKNLFSFYIATLNSTNVITILFHSPIKMTGQESNIWNTFVTSIQRPGYKKIKSEGEDATEVIASIIKSSSSKYDVTYKIDIMSTIGSDSALTRPTINQTIEIVESPDGIKTLVGDFQATHELVKKTSNGTDTTLFGPPWSIPDIHFVSAFEKGKISGEIKSSQGSDKIPNMAIEEFQKKNADSYNFLAGNLFMTSLPHNEFLTEFKMLFNFKVKDSTTLVGTPNRKNILTLLDHIGMPRKRRGLVIVDELMKRWALATITYDDKSFLIDSIKVDGINKMRPQRTEMSIKRLVK
jgi:hypothetical protein